MDFVLLFFNERTYSNRSIKNQLPGPFQCIIFYLFWFFFITES